MSMRLQGGDEMIAIGAFDRRLAGGINIGDDDRIGVVEAARELIEKRVKARIAMRTARPRYLAFGRSAGGAQHGGDLDRMMAVIVRR